MMRALVNLRLLESITDYAFNSHPRYYYDEYEAEPAATDHVASLSQNFGTASPTLASMDSTEAINGSSMLHSLGAGYSFVSSFGAGRNNGGLEEQTSDGSGGAHAIVKEIMNVSSSAAAAMTTSIVRAINASTSNIEEDPSALIESSSLEVSPSSSSPSLRSKSPAFVACLSCLYFIGIAGNAAALWILTKKESKRARKIVIMLTFLAFNDLVGLLGMCVLLYLQNYLSRELARQQWLCALRVIWRAFGLGSGSVSLVMAVDRWLALNYPFISQTRVTPTRIRRTILLLWAFMVCLACLPFTGFGLYYDPNRKPDERCVRYRFATDTIDIIYAYIFFFVGVTMCVVIVSCNLGVIRVMCIMGKNNIARQESNLNNAAAQYYQSSMKRLNAPLNRESSKSSRGGFRRSTDGSQRQPSITTKEEIAFAKVLGVLCIGFVVCWLPQMISIIIAQVNPRVTHRSIYYVADVLMMLNFTLDPYVYVVYRRCRYNRMMKRRNAQRPGVSRPVDAFRESNGISNTGNSFRMDRMMREGSRFSREPSKEITRETRLTDYSNHQHHSQPHHPSSRSNPHLPRSCHSEGSSSAGAGGVTFDVPALASGMPAVTSTTRFSSKDLEHSSSGVDPEAPEPLMSTDAIEMDANGDPVEKEYVPLELLLEHSKKEKAEQALTHKKRHKRPRLSSTSTVGSVTSTKNKSSSSSSSASVGKFFKRQANSLLELANSASSSKEKVSSEAFSSSDHQASTTSGTTVLKPSLKSKQQFDAEVIEECNESTAGGKNKFKHVVSFTGVVEATPTRSPSSGSVKFHRLISTSASNTNLNNSAAF